MNFTQGDTEPGTAEWAEQLMEYLDISPQEDSKEEDEEPRVSEPFRVRIPNRPIRDLQLVPNEQDKGEKKTSRKRIIGIKRKTRVEVKTLVLEQMAEEEPTIQREIKRNTTRAIFVEKDSVTVLRPRELKYKYYEMDDLQFNLYSARVKEETEKDKVKVNKQKQAILEEMNRIQEVRGSSDIII